MATIPNDVAAERGLLAGIFKYGSDTFLDISDIVKTSSFSIDSNKIIFKCITNACIKNEVESIDLPTILSSAKELDLDHYFDRPEEQRHLNSIMQLSVERTNVRKFAARIRKLELARLLSDKGEDLKNKMAAIDGSEAIAQILGIAESTVLDFTGMFDGEDELQPKKIGDGIEEYVRYLADNPCEVVGIPTGFPEFDKSIGGGLLPGVSMIGARPKVGKTTLSINMGHNIAEKEIPVLYLDTEMIEVGRYRDISDKILAMLSNIDITEIKTGKFADSEEKKARVFDTAKQIKDRPFYRIDIAGKPFEDQLYIIRRWVQSVVGFNTDGTAKECVIIYDYLKLMDAKDMNSNTSEWLLLGMMMTALQSFSTKNAIPFVAFTQLNRDGINKESSDVVSGSDRISWFCTSLTIFKYKSEDEIAKDGPELGNRKMVTILSRYGPGHDFGEKVNLFMNKWRAQIREISEENNKDFVVTTNDDQIPFE